MQNARRSLAYVLLIVSVAILPSAAMLGWYQVTQNPNLRPFGITREALRAYGDPESGVDLVVFIDWPETTARDTARRHLAGDIASSFTSKGVEARFVFRDRGSAPLVTYVIGKSVIGPYPARQASRGITAAVQAYRMH